MAATKKPRKKKTTVKLAPATAGATTRTGRTADGGQYIFHIEFEGLEINGEPVDGQMAADFIGDLFEQGVGRPEEK